MRILVSGYLGLGNLGDEAIFAGLARGLAARGHAVRALSGSPAETRAVHGVPAWHRLRDLPWALGRADAVVSGGGGLLQDATSYRSLLYYLGVIRAARATGARVVVFGQSIGPLSPRGRRAVVRALAGLPVAVRDAPSQVLLSEAGIDAPRFADTALALPVGAFGRVGGVLLVPRADVAGARAGLEAVARDAIAAGRPVGVVPLQSGADEEDADAIVSSLPGVERRSADTADDALARCAEVDLVVSARLHGLILAARAGVAHVGVAYDPKVGGFLAVSGGAAAPVPVDPEALVRLAATAATPGDDLGESLRASAEAGLDWLDRALRDGAAPGDDRASDARVGDSPGSMTP